MEACCELGKEGPNVTLKPFDADQEYPQGGMEHI